MTLVADEKEAIQQAYSGWLAARELKPRYGQRLMVAEVSRHLAGLRTLPDADRAAGAHLLMIEAGTGTGKTVAYAIPALVLSRALGRQLVIATATVALQEQLVGRDLPDLAERSGLDFSIALVKGRSRYACRLKLDRWLSDEGPQNMALALYPDEGGPLLTGNERDTWQAMLEALEANEWDGDRDSWSSVVADSIWSPLTTDHSQCTGRRCPHVSRCPYFMAREAVEGADCAVTNHDLVLADCALGGGVILPDPADTIYIFDEAHQLADKAQSHFGFRQRLGPAMKLLDQGGKALAMLAQQAPDDRSIADVAARFPALAQELTEYLRRTGEMAAELLAEHGSVDSERAERERYRFRCGEVPDLLREHAEIIAAAYQRAAVLVGRLRDHLEDLVRDGHTVVGDSELDLWLAAAGSLAGRLESGCGLWQSYARSDDGRAPQARWITGLAGGGVAEVELAAVPVDAGAEMAANVWSRCFGAVLTSATLAVAGDFARIAGRTGLGEQARFAQVPSPFRYREAAVLRIPDIGADGGNGEAHTRALIEHLPALIDVEEATLVLFSARRQMQRVLERLPEALRERVLCQDHWPKAGLLRRHRERIDAGEGSVIFGLASFAEGIDLPGDYCRHVIIAKIPFAVPDDPVEATLAEWVRSRGGNPFAEIAVPDAALRLVQASGRLLRSEQDTGAITLLDGRILTKSYGRTLLQSLPDYTVERS